MYFVTAGHKAACQTLLKVTVDLIADCEYGDIATGCESRHCSIDDNLPLCCGTCNYGDPITTTPTSPTITAATNITAHAAGTITISSSRRRRNEMNENVIASSKRVLSKVGRAVQNKNSGKDFAMNP